MVHTLASNGANSIWEHSLLDPAQVQSGRRKANPQDKVHPTKSEFIRAKYQMLAFVHKLPCRDDDGVTAKDLSKQLHSSVRTGNLETCLRLLSLGAQANFFHPEKGTTPLHVAAKAGQILQAELLVVYGADPGAPDVNGRTPIDYARQAAQHELAERLVECQYELTDRLAFYLCGRKPDHKNGHYIIPQMADRVRPKCMAQRYCPLGSWLRGPPMPLEVEDEALYSMHIPASVYRIRKGPSGSSVPFPPSSPLLSCQPDGARHMSKLDRHGSGTDSDYDNTQGGEVLISMEGKRFVELSKDEDFPHELDPLDGELDPGLPSTEDVILKTEQVTKNIQELLRAAQESKHDSFVPCSEKIHSAVTEMASLFPKKPALETVRSSLRLLNASAYRLQSECRKTVPPE
ncbi:ARF GTPase-activating protein GIT1, partial [Manacus vitellinus]|uniref:ARF GTPase-activating protein GIT1 n=1 Tax=Manacus vitellinus TaxID=328815 RepID=UPI00115E4A2F